MKLPLLLARNLITGPTSDSSVASSPNGGAHCATASNRLSTTVVADDATRMFELRPLTANDAANGGEKNFTTTAIVCESAIA